MAVTVADLHLHEWTKTDERKHNKGHLWVCACGEGRWSQRPNGPFYQGPFGWTERELETISWLSQGLSLREAAVAMGLDCHRRLSTFLTMSKKKSGVSTIEEVVSIYRQAYPDVE